MSAYALAHAAFAAEFTPPPPPDVKAWAERNIVFDERSPIPGRFSTEKFPFFNEILECLSPDHPAREVTVRGDAQFGKTSSVIHPTLGCWLEYAPIDALVVHPTQSSAKEWVRRKWKPLRRSAPSLIKIFGRGGASNVDTVFDMESLDLTRSLKVVSAGSPSDLTGTTRRLVIMDDLSKFEASEHGDPEFMAESRASGYDDAKIARISTAMLKGTCRITRAYDRSDRREFFVPCPHCSHKAPLTWENFLQSIDIENLQSAHFTCEACGEAIRQEHKEKIVAAGEWRATNPHGDHPGFHIWGRALAPQRDFASIAIDYAKAFGLTSIKVSEETATDLTKQSSAKPEQVFWNDVLGLPYEQASSAPDWTSLRDRVENAAPEDQFDLGRIPTGGLMLTAGVDCQEDRTEVQIKAYGPNVRSWTVDYRVIPHKIDEAECWEALDALLAAEWKTVLGRGFPLEMMAIDGGAFTNDVWDFSKRHPWSRVIIVKGARSQTGPAYQLMKFERRRDGAMKRRQKRAYQINTALLKGDYYRRLAILDPDARGAVGFATGLGDEFYRQTTSEHRVVVRTKSGVMESRWDLVEPTRRNEALDTSNYADVAALRIGWRANTEAQWDERAAIWSAPVAAKQRDLFDPEADVPAAEAPAAKPAQATVQDRRSKMARLP